MIYYVKEGQNSIFFSIKVLGNECEICRKLYATDKIEKMVKKMKKKNINAVILSKKIKTNRAFVAKLKNYDITIFDGKWLMKYMINDIIRYLEDNNKKQIFEEIGILVNDLTKEIEQSIRKFADTYKKIRIVTNHHEMFKKLEEELYKEKGISIIITNNRRKALAKLQLIVNFDFVNENINEYNINENATIINLCNDIKINKKRFGGLIINDYEVGLSNDSNDIYEFLDLKEILEKKQEFELKEILEANIYSKVCKMLDSSSIERVENIVKEYGIKVQGIYGINGRIT